MRHKTILFVAMQMSTHAVRWINQISDQEWDVHLFPVNYLPVHPEMRNVTVHQPWFMVRPRAMIKQFISHPYSLFRRSWTFREEAESNRSSTEAIYPFPIFSRMAPYINGVRRVRLGESNATAPAVYGPKVLARLIRKLKPDLIHSLEFQHCGYNVLRAKEIIGNSFPSWLATNWGSDIYYYRQFEEHRRQISRLLRNADYYSCECERDVLLAKELGFSGRVMPVIPNTGGLDITLSSRLRTSHKPSKRRLIMLKGYQHFAGRALTALDALEQCAEEIRTFRIVVFSASPEVVARVQELQLAGVELDIAILPHVGHDAMLRMFARARIYIGVSVSDAISTSLLEAIAMGTFPIQTDTSCCDEWIQDGVSGFSVPVDDIQVIADRICEAARNDELVDQAAVINWETVLQRLDQANLKQEAIDFYHSIFEVEDPQLQ